ncbi:MAG: zeta toxin family protein, partial [Alphaproteobacteria bacterium]|nr:zeta toxin family protein [Alphaproteobacteria bacterium]
LSADDKETQLNFSSTPSVFLMVGLQGAGKTTTSGKLGLYLTQKQKKKVLLASLDIYRPAAQEQLRQVGAQVQVDVLPIVPDESVSDITKRALSVAKTKGYNVLILDTAGRLHIDEPLMEEVRHVKSLANPCETLLVVDSLTGQDAANIAKSFHENIGITGTILTRLDADPRGGAALSMRSITEKPIKFIGVGEKLEDLELFDPARLAGRILDMGDIVALVEKAQSIMNEAEAEKLAKRMEAGKFDFNDMARQLRQVEKMGGLDGIMNMLPGMGQMKDKIEKVVGEKKIIQRQMALINSMTKQERRYPKLINPSRRKRIILGAGSSPQEFNTLMKQFEKIEKVVKKMKKIGMQGMMRGGLESLFKGR